jgi:Rrf2 family transcriptional regulator, iron-sulfur cluster assembly transcription factor
MCMGPLESLVSPRVPPHMSFLPRKGLLAIAAVVDVALNGSERPISARKLAARHSLPARHLEPVLQALVHEGIFNGVRGPRGGYELARERKRISVADILRAAGSVDDEDDVPSSRILAQAVLPALADAERAFVTALSRLSLDEITRRAEALPRS